MMKDGIMKIGGSCLNSGSDYSDIGRELRSIFDFYRPRRLFVVVSARKGETDRIIRENCRAEEEDRLKDALKGIGNYEIYDNPDLAGRLLAGEIESARLLVESIPGEATVLDQDSPSYPVVGNSGYLNAKVDVSLTMANRKMLDGLEGIIVVSGFGGRNPKGEKVLFGRNASDLVAAYVLQLSGDSGRVCFLKDVDCVYSDYGGMDKRRISYIARKDLNNFVFGKVLDDRVVGALLDKPYEAVVTCIDDMEAAFSETIRKGTLIRFYGD